MIKKNILLVIGRNNIIKDKELIHSLKHSLADVNYEYIFYGPKDADTVFFLQNQIQFLDNYPRLRKIAKACVLLMYPARWSYYFAAFRREQPIEKQTKKLASYIEKLQKGNIERKISVLSRSSGGRASSLIADRLGIERLICLGYPFKHPKKEIEPERYEHLASLRTPFLILQGEHDEYGGREILSQYTLSPSVSLEFVNTDHNFRLKEPEYNTVVDRIKQFIEIH